MSKIQISFKANLSSDNNGKKAKLFTRDFKAVSVNLHDTYKENLAYYGEDFIQDALTGTSILVQIQNTLRSRALLLKDSVTVDKSEVKGNVRMWRDAKDFRYTITEIQSFADSYKPQMNKAAQEWAEKYDSASPAMQKAMLALRTIEDDAKQKAKEIKAQMAVFEEQGKSSDAKGSVVKDRKKA